MTALLTDSWYIGDNALALLQFKAAEVSLLFYYVYFTDLFYIRKYDASD